MSGNSHHYSLLPVHEINLGHNLLSLAQWPANDINMYLQFLVDQLKDLPIDGLMTYHASCNKILCMHTSLMWTINAFQH